MSYYISVYLFLYFGIIKKILNKYYFILILFFCFLISGTRKEIGGTDYIAYKLFFNFDISENPWDYDILFVYLRNIIKLLYGNYFIFLLVISLFSQIFIYRIFKMYSNWALASFFLYYTDNFLWQNFTIIRSSLSIFFFWLSLKEIKNKNFYRYFLYWLLMCGFHRGAFPLIFLYFFLNKKIKKIVLIFITIIILLLSINLPEILNYFNFNFLNNYLKEAFIQTPRGFLYNIIKKLLIYGIIYLTIDKQLKDNKNIFYNLVLLEIELLILVYKIPSFTRYAQYFSIGAYIVLGDIMLKEYNNKKYYIILFILLLFTSNFYKLIISDLYINYQSWLLI